MEVRIKRSKVQGVVAAPPSKSYTQRAVACALLADGTTEILNPSRSEDALSALRAAEMLGASVKRGETAWEVSSHGIETPDDIVDCGGSATAMRFFTALSALAPGATVLTGDATLRRRPMDGLISALNSLGARCFSTKGDGMPPLVVLGGGIVGGEAVIRGDVSSQFISALIIACTKSEKGAAIRLSSSLESKHYVEMTIYALECFGGRCETDFMAGVFKVPSRQSLMPCKFPVEGDYSSAAFMLAAGILAGDVEVRGTAPLSRQGDRIIVEIMQRMGGKVSPTEGGLRARESSIKGVELDATNVPDLVPVVAAMASKADGETVIRGIRRLRYKESDRVAAISEAIGSMGGYVRSEEDVLAVSGGRGTRGTEIDPRNDHRIAMACAILGLASEGETVIRNAECVSKSYPSFFDDLRSIGGEVEVVR